MALNSASARQSVTYRTGKDYGRKQGELIVRKLAFNNDETSR
jgi:hypothetical protein